MEINVHSALASRNQKLTMIIVVDILRTQPTTVSTVLMESSTTSAIWAQEITCSTWSIFLIPIAPPRNDQKIYCVCEVRAICFIEECDFVTSVLRNGAVVLEIKYQPLCYYTPLYTYIILFNLCSPY